MDRKLQQKNYRKRRYNRGLCQRCKNRRMRGKVLCEACTISRRLWQRKYIGAEPWHQGGRGRPIKYKSDEKRARSAVSGEYVTEEFAKANPSTTVVESEK